jgi:predicted site-specific integrase-resolvase
MDAPATAECYTMREAAEALGRSMLSLKRWIKMGLLPPPVLRDTTRNYLQYSRGELLVICRELGSHEREYSLYSAKHETTTHRIWQAIQAYRSTHI